MKNIMAAVDFFFLKLHDPWITKHWYLPKHCGVPCTSCTHTQMKALPLSLLAHIFSLQWVPTFNMWMYEEWGCFTPNKGHVANISTDQQYLNSLPSAQTVSSIMIAGPGSREHGGVTQLQMWRYLAIWAGSRWSWDNTNSVSGIVLMQVVSTSHKCQAVQASTNEVAESSPISALSSVSSSPMAELAPQSIPVQSLKLRSSSSAPHTRHQLTDWLTSCVWHRGSTHIRKDDVCLQEV